MLEYTLNKFEIQPRPRPIFIPLLAGNGLGQKLASPAGDRAGAPVDL